jgi:hypothetical protein
MQAGCGRWYFINILIPAQGRTMIPIDDRFIPYTSVAVRLRGETGWRMGTLPCEPGQVERRMAGKGWNAAAWVEIGRGHALPDALGCWLDEDALAKGWAWDAPARCWRAPDEPATAPDGVPHRGSLSLSWRRIGFGWAVLEVRAGADALELDIDDIWDDFAPVVRFIHRLIDGKPSRFGVVGNMTMVAVIDTETEGVCRLTAGPVERGVMKPAVDALIDRAGLILAFRHLLHDLASHPGLGPGWLFHAGSDSEVYDRLSDEAGRLWDEGVRAGRFPADFDAEMDFEADYMAQRMPLTPDQHVFLEKYQTMLRTLVIPGKGA